MTTLSRRLSEMVTAWDLTVDGDVRQGPATVVQPVRDRDGDACILKVSVVDDENGQESATLQVWQGRGAAELLRADPRRGALLLERLGPSLTEVGTEKAYAEVARLYGGCCTGRPGPSSARCPPLSDGGWTNSNPWAGTCQRRPGSSSRRCSRVAS